MSDSVNFKMEGINELVTELRNTQEKVAAEEASALKAGAEPIASEARRIVQVKSGKLRGEIAISNVTSARTRKSIKIGLPAKSGAAYGVPLEFGHVNKNQYGGAKTGSAFTQPYPFMAPAYETQKGTAYRIIRERIIDVLKQRGLR